MESLLRVQIVSPRVAQSKTPQPQPIVHLLSRLLSTRCGRCVALPQHQAPLEWQAASTATPLSSSAHESFARHLVSAACVYCRHTTAEAADTVCPRPRHTDTQQLLEALFHAAAAQGSHARSKSRLASSTSQTDSNLTLTWPEMMLALGTVVGQPSVPKRAAALFALADPQGTGIVRKSAVSQCMCEQSVQFVCIDLTHTISSPGPCDAPSSWRICSVPP